MYNNIGVRCCQDRRFDQALLFFDESLKFKPDNELTLRNRSTVSDLMQANADTLSH